MFGGGGGKIQIWLVSLGAVLVVQTFPERGGSHSVNSAEPECFRVLGGAGTFRGMLGNGSKYHFGVLL